MFIVNGSTWTMDDNRMLETVLGKLQTFGPAELTDLEAQLVFHVLKQFEQATQQKRVTGGVQMTSERKAELRRLAEIAPGIDRGIGIDAAKKCANAIPELLDELEAAEAQRNHYIREFDHASFERDSLAAQVGMLRDKASEFLSASRLSVGLQRARREALLSTVYDTEAAATTWLEAHDREQQLAGARELVRRVPAHTDPYAPEWVSASGMRAVLEAMEHEDATESKPPPPAPPDHPMHTQL